MKNLKTIAITLLSLILALAMTASAESAAPGAITINGVSEDSVYEVYQMLDLESYDTVAGAYAYKVNKDWTGFFASADAKAYMTVDTDGYVTWTNESSEDKTVAAFAKLALAYAEANKIAPVKSSKNEGEFVITAGTTGNTGKFTDLELGYYLVDSNLGALCGLTTTNPAAVINAKNSKPTLEKRVQEDSTEQWGTKNTADIGQTVNFRTTINVHAGAQNYVLHDSMSEGLKFTNVSKIEHVIPGTTNTVTVVDNKYYTVVTEGLTDGCDFEIKFTQEFCDHVNTNDKVIVYYSAMLTRDAIVSGDGNSNESWLDFGEGHHTTHDSTKTYTFGFDIVKTDGQNKLIDGAKFKIYDAQTGGNEVAVVLMDDGETYRRARADETGEEIVVTNGQVRVVGFDNGTYYLEETEAPDGYNKLTSRQKFIISDANLDAAFTDGIFSTGSGVHVVNKTGTMLPETGGMGTALFVAGGMVVVLGAGVLLVTKKRMSMIQG